MRRNNVLPIVYGKYDTPLSPKQEKEFQLWAKTYSSPDINLSDTSNYDMRGYFLENGGKPHKKGDHFPDTYKKPNHITHSTYSQYEPEKGGQWVNSAEDETGDWTFIPSKYQTSTAQQRNNLRQYFEKYEPSSTLNIQYQEAQDATK